MLREAFNTDWYVEKEGPAPWRAGPLTLPHDAMIYETRDPATPNGHNTGYFPGGVYRYTKTFFAPESLRGRTVLFEFEGVYMDAQVHFNGALAAARPNGYANFYADAEGLLVYGQDNRIEVLARSDQMPNSRWYSGSGIYREVKLLSGGWAHILPDGVKLRTLALEQGGARIEAALSARNRAPAPCAARAVLELRGPDGQLAARAEGDLLLRPGQIETLRLPIALENPALWSPEHPDLYACTARLLEGQTLLDEARETFGVRVLELDARRGLRINGQALKLRGGCLHHDNGVIGACTLPAAEDRRVRLMQASGFNAIRSAHNPASKALLEACDRRGMLVIDEFSDVWYRPKTAHDYAEHFRDWWERDIQAMVDKDYNHPSVVMYSIGNEIRETVEAEGVEYSRRLAEKVKALDPSRYVINSINGWYNMFSSLSALVRRKRPAAPGSGLADTHKRTSGYINPLMNTVNRFMDLIVALPLVDWGTRAAFAAVDVAGYNYMAGRYAMDGRLYPRRVICGSESFPPEIARNWRRVKRLAHVIGDFTWAGWDYLGEAGLCTWQYGANQALYKPYPCILADSPLIDITGQRQAQSYLHEIVWGLRKDPYIAVRPLNHAGETPSKSVWRGTNAIASWTWPGCEGRPALIEVYADAAWVELFLNGRSLGRKAAGDRRDFKAIFRTVYQPGELRAVAYDRGGRETGRAVLCSASGALDLRVQPESTALRADGADLAYIHIALAGTDGIVDPLAERLVTVRVEGAGSLQGFGSANPLSQERFTDDTHTTYQGRALAVVRAGNQAGSVRVEVSAPGCQTRILVLPVQ